MKWPITTIGLDADDTLWHNENLFEDHHRKYCALLSEYHDAKTVERVLYETAISLTDGAIKAEEIRRIIDHCRQMLLHPVELLEGVEGVLQGLNQRFRLLLITKGDLRDQERKIAKSGIAHHFGRTEIVSDKTVEAYARVLQRNEIPAEQFLMVGNSLKSDILPVLDLGGHGVHIPYRITWEHEHVQSPPHDHDNFYQLESIQQLPDLIDAIVLGNNS
jgi:putative hydrolase of the HAD superfamily